MVPSHCCSAPTVFPSQQLNPGWGALVAGRTSPHSASSLLSAQSAAPSHNYETATHAPSPHRHRPDTAQ